MFLSFKNCVLIKYRGIVRAGHSNLRVMGVCDAELGVIRWEATCQKEGVFQWEPFKMAKNGGHSVRNWTNLSGFGQKRGSFSDMLTKKGDHSVRAVQFEQQWNKKGGQSVRAVWKGGHLVCTYQSPNFSECPPSMLEKSGLIEKLLHL